jgi:hypothetical protein
VKVPLVELAAAGLVGNVTLPVRWPAVTLAKFPSLLCDVDPLLELVLLPPELELLPAEAPDGTAAPPEPVSALLC